MLGASAAPPAHVAPSPAGPARGRLAAHADAVGSSRPEHAAGPAVASHAARRHRGRPLPVEPRSRERLRAAARQVTGQGRGPHGPHAPAAPLPQPGSTKVWLAFDDVNGELYAKEFTLRGLGKRIEVWVASGADQVSSGLGFPAGDCRNGHRTQLTDAHVRHLVTEFDGNVFPTMSSAFGTPRPRDGSRATLTADLGLPAGYFAGPGDRVVALVDNIRDDNFYDTHDARGLAYLAGFFDPSLSRLVDRNVMTVDGFDWLHRTGERPPHQPAAGNPCASAPAQPFMIESVFAHEYQHLLAYDQDPDETLWLDEGLSTWAETVTGYKRPDRPVTQVGFDGHVQCFLGHIGKAIGGPSAPRGGPENSLTGWGDQDPEEILCEYGAARTAVGYLAGRYGPAFVKALHLDDADGLVSVQRQLDRFAPGDDVVDVLEDWASMIALDGVIDGGAELRTGAELRGGAEKVLTEPTLKATVGWDSADTHSTPGVPPNGADFVRLRGADGRYLNAAALESVTFEAPGTLPPRPVEWAVDRDPPGRPRNPALRAGSGLGLDRSIVRAVAVPAGAPTLTFATYYSIERGFDFGFVQVSTDGGRTYRSLAGSVTTAQAAPQAEPPIRERLPGITGVSGGGRSPTWVTASFDLSAYAGREVLLAFTYVTDRWKTAPGWWVDDVRIGGRPLTDGSHLAGWRSATQVRPVPVHDLSVRLVGYTGDHQRAWLVPLPLDERHGARLDRAALRQALGGDADVVAAIVTYGERTETHEQYAPYRLTVNGVVQPGGGPGGVGGV